MYTNAAKQLLSTILDTSRNTVRSDRTRLLNDIKLVLGITAYLDPDTLWEASYLASREFIAAAARVDTAMDTLTAAFRATKPQQVTPPKTVVANTLLEISPSSQVYATELETLLKKFPRRDLSSAQVYDVQAGLKTLRDSLLLCFKSALVLKSIPNIRMRLFTSYFADRIKAWVTEVIEKTPSDLEAVEQLGAIHQLVLMSQTGLETPSIKYTGACTLGTTEPARIQIGSPVYAVPGGTTMGWKNDPDVAVPYTVWTIPTATPAEIDLGDGCNPVGPITPNQWVVTAANLNFECRANNEVYTGVLLAGTRNSVDMRIHLDAQVTGALPRPFDFVVSGTNILIQMLDANRSPGMQLYFAGGAASFNSHCDAAQEGWYQGAYAPGLLTSTNAPTIVQESSFPVGQEPLAATLNAAGTITLATANTSILADDLITVNYLTGFGQPHRATYRIDSIVAGLTITVTAGHSSPADFATSGAIPTTVATVPESVEVEISRVNNFIEDASYLDVAGEVELDVAAATAYATGFSVVPATTPDVPVRVGDIVAYGSSGATDVVSGLDPIRVVTGISTEVTSVTISSGLGDALGALPMGDALRKEIALGSSSILGRLHDLMAATTWTSFSAFSNSADQLLTDISDLSTVLSAAQFSVKRLPWVITMLRQHGYDRAEESLRRGDIFEFIPQTALDASGASSVLNQLNLLINSL